uniref:Putative til domain protein n=1 Tax=Xenopsylla cheopis TaxID=163159 RepID=A0A6M2DZ88_XENCH
MKLLYLVLILSAIFHSSLSYTMVMRHCAQNEEFKNCGSACESTCENPYPRICSAQCILSICQCVRGYARRSDGRCVPISQCEGNQINGYRQYIK